MVRYRDDDDDDDRNVDILQRFEHVYSICLVNITNVLVMLRWCTSLLLCMTTRQRAFVAFRVSVSRRLQGSGVSDTFSASDVTRFLGPRGE